MRRLDSLFREYVADHRAGRDSDPQSYLRRLPPAERPELIALIDGYLSRAPRRAFDTRALRGSTTERTVEALGRALAGESGLWPALLPELRDRAGLRRDELVTRLSATLGLAGREAKVGDYYHRMEQGRLAARGVSDRVLAALGELLGESTAALRAAGTALTPAGGLEDSVGFARTAPAEPGATARLAVAAAAPGARDEVDELFAGR